MIKVYEQVIKYIEDMIISGELKSGDKLPPERELADMLQVSRTSIREAIRSLDIMGLIECRQGDGNFIREGFENVMLQPLSLMFILQDKSNEEIIEFREMIEIETARLAAERITKEQIEKLGFLLEKYKETIDNTEGSNIDKEFHYEIVKASQNTLTISILDVISRVIENHIKDLRMQILIDENSKIILIKQHEEIFKYIKAHDGENAANAMKKHMDIIRHFQKNN